MLIFISLLAMAPFPVVRGHPTKISFPNTTSNSTVPHLMKPVNRIPTNASMPLVFPETGNFKGLQNFRLPSSLKPVEYRIKIFPVPSGSPVFRGHVEIDLEVIEPTSVIHLNAANLTLDITSLTVTASGGESLKVTNHSLNAKQQVGTFTLEKTLSLGDIITFSSSYEGHLKNSSFGLNEIIYLEEDGTESRVLATYMQPIGARQVFPCMDEPGLKARFVLQIGSFKGHKVLSNMPIERMSLAGSGTYLWYKFRKSLPMSTYLVAFVISDFESRSHSKVRVWSRKTVSKKRVFAARLAPKCLKWFERYFNVDYVLPKLDLVTFPSYTVSGMENFGLIMTSEASLLTNGKLRRKEWVATVIAHEVAHQWVGNLVTPIWWTQYWLSEGFATYLAALALDELEPSLEAMNHLLVEYIHMTMSQDVDERSVVLVEEHFNPLVSIFKSSSMYYKGSAMVRMLISIFGEALFKEGLTQFLQTFRFKTVSESDLYSALMRVVNSCQSKCSFYQNQTLPTTLDKIMGTWTKQKGYPLITVTRTPEGGVSVKQKMYRKNGDYHQHPSYSSNASGSLPLWWIPISFASSVNPDFSLTYPRAWLHPSKEDTLLKGVGRQHSWIVLNLQETTYARVNYDASLWKAITTQLSRNHKVIHVLNRAQLFNDAYHLFHDDHIEVTPLMDMLSYLSKEDNYFPLKSAFDSLRFIELIMRGSVHYPLLKNFALSFLSPLLSGPFGKNHMEMKRYHLVLSWACKFQIPTCTKLAKKVFKKFQRVNDIGVFPEIGIAAFLCSAIEEGTDKEWHFLFQKILTISKRKLRLEMIDGLTCSKNLTLVQRYMEDIASPALNLTLADAMEMFNSLARNPRYNKETWAFLASHYTYLMERFNDIPLPFVNTLYDLEQLKLILKEKHVNSAHSKDNSYFLNESEAYATENDRIVSSVSTWLVQNSADASQV